MNRSAASTHNRKAAAAAKNAALEPHAPVSFAAHPPVKIAVGLAVLLFVPIAPDAPFATVAGMTEVAFPIG